MEELNGEHEAQVGSYLRFAQLKRRLAVKEVELSFEDIRDQNLFEARAGAAARAGRCTLLVSCAGCRGGTCTSCDTRRPLPSACRT